MLCLAFAMAESLRVHMQMSPPPVAAATISLAIGFGAALSTFWLSFTAELDPAILELQTYSSTYLELALQLSGGLHAYDHVFMGTPLLDVNTADPSDLATLERLDTTLIERITTWWLALPPLDRAQFKRLLTAVQATNFALHRHAGDLGFGFFRTFFDRLEVGLVVPTDGSNPSWQWLLGAS